MSGHPFLSTPTDKEKIAAIISGTLADERDYTMEEVVDEAREGVSGDAEAIQKTIARLEVQKTEIEDSQQWMGATKDKYMENGTDEDQNEFLQVEIDLEERLDGVNNQLELLHKESEMVEDRAQLRAIKESFGI